MSLRIFTFLRAFSDVPANYSEFIELYYFFLLILVKTIEVYAKNSALYFISQRLAIMEAVDI